MLSFCLFEGLFEPNTFDQLSFPQNIYGRLHGPAWAQAIEAAEKELKKPNGLPGSNLPREDAQEFYNGLGKKFGYTAPENIPYDQVPYSWEMNSPWTMSDEEKEDLIKNGSYVDQFNKEQPSFGNAVVPFEYRSNDNAGDPGTWGGV